ncbi:metH [Symbiodinium sp. CCMP2592]|nr:metH [Symbiodinium sp. CCMP2592]
MKASISTQPPCSGEIGLRKAIYGSRDVFAQFDLGQKLIGPADTSFRCQAALSFLNMPLLRPTE